MSGLKSRRGHRKTPMMPRPFGACNGGVTNCRCRKLADLLPALAKLRSFATLARSAGHRSMLGSYCRPGRAGSLSVPEPCEAFERIQHASNPPVPAVGERGGRRTDCSETVRLATRCAPYGRVPRGDDLVSPLQWPHAHHRRRHRPGRASSASSSAWANTRARRHRRSSRAAEPGSRG